MATFCLQIGIVSLRGENIISAEINRTIKSETPFRYVWFKINGSTSNQQWVALAEWQVFKVREKVIDPELNDTTIIEY